MMKTYERYKPSGVEWIGDIPEHWEIKRLKYFAGVNSSDSTININKDSDEEVVFLPMEKVSEDGGITQDLRKRVNETSSGFTYFERGDVILAKITPCFENGKGALLDKLETDFGFGSTEFHTIKANKDVSAKLLFFITKSHRFRMVGEAFMSGSAGQKRVSTEFVKDFEIALPALSEQTAIANYLDEKTAQLDKLIENKRRLIALLKAESSGVINNAVTRGINPQAKLKPSGIDWLGEIPEHWEVKRLKFISPKISVGLVINPSTYFDEAGTVPMLTGKNVSPAKINAGSANLITEESNEQLYKTQLHEDDVVVVRVGYPGVAAVVRKNVAGANCASMVIVRKGDFNSDFLSNCFNSAVGKAQVEMVEYGAAQKQFNISHVIDFLFPLPPIEEQNQIVQFIEAETGKIDATVAKIEKEIEYLLEYRTALISEVVTGKIKVV